MDTKPELVFLLVADVDRPEGCYKKLGWRLDASFTWPTVSGNIEGGPS